MQIDRCYCFQQTFSRLKALAESCGATTVEELQDYATFGQNCQLCHPYVRRMLRTGQTIFDEIIRDEDEPPEGAALK